LSHDWNVWGVAVVVLYIVLYIKRVLAYKGNDLLAYPCLGRCNDGDGGQKVLAWVAPWPISHIHLFTYSMSSQHCEVDLLLLWLGR
jgi:hypothetical protein